MTQIKTLRQTNPLYDNKRWDDLEALAKGGRLFHDKIRRFLPQNPVEPTGVYNSRTAQAHYHSYIGTITSLYVAWLFSADFTVRPHVHGVEQTEPPAFYGEFQENVGEETTFTAFAQERFREALQMGKSYWLAELPPKTGEVTDRAEWEKQGLGRATLRELKAEAVLDWEKDNAGEYKYAVVYSQTVTRESWEQDRNTIVEQWRIYDPVNVTTFESKYQRGKKPADTTNIEPIEVAAHGFQRVPLVSIELPVEICIGEQGHDPQLEHFRLDNALSWLIRRTCYSQPVFKIEDGDKLPTMGAGYAIVLGKDDDFSWSAPPVAPFDILQKNIEAKRDEVFRITHTMAQSVDNNAETVGRSADSKEIDAAATRIMLQEYGKFVAKAIEETYEIISEARGEDFEWSVEGFSGYDTATVSSLIANAVELRLMGIPSPTLHKQANTKVAMAFFAGEDQRVKDKIRKEIESADYQAATESPETELLKAKATDLLAKAKAEPVKAAAAKTSADASQITAKKPTPKPAPRPTAK